MTPKTVDRVQDGDVVVTVVVRNNCRYSHQSGLWNRESTSRRSECTSKEGELESIGWL